MFNSYSTVLYCRLQYSTLQYRVAGAYMILSIKKKWKTENIVFLLVSFSKSILTSPCWLQRLSTTLIFPPGCIGLLSTSIKVEVSYDTKILIFKVFLTIQQHFLSPSTTDTTTIHQHNTIEDLNKFVFWIYFARLNFLLIF